MDVNCEKTIALADGSLRFISNSSSRSASILVELTKRSRSAPMRAMMERRARALDAAAAAAAPEPPGSRQVGHAAGGAPGAAAFSSSAPMHARQNWWPHAVVTASSAASKQMPHSGAGVSVMALPAALSAGRPGG